MNRSDVTPHRLGEFGAFFRYRRIIAAFASWFCVVFGARANENPGGWSAELLRQILRTDAPKTEAVAPTPAGEMVLHSYRLTHLRVGEAGKTQNVLTILGKLLPAGSSINPDVPANTVHVLTTPAAHKAVWDYLSAVDAAETPLPTAAIPDEVQQALKRLADSSEQSAKVAVAMGALKTDVAKEIDRIDTRQRNHSIRLALGGLGFALLVLIVVGWMSRRRSTSPAPTAASTSLTLAPEQLATALTPVHDKMRGDMLGLLNEVAIKLQAQHNEQQKLVREQQLQLEDARQALVAERRQFLTDAGSMVVQAVERVDATTAKLAHQQDKVAELVEELQTTVRELDQTKDDLRDKQIELEQERAKIAALSLLLEEGSPLPPAVPAIDGHRGHHDPSSPPSAVNGDSRIPDFDLPCTTTATRTPSTTADPTETTGRIRLTFLPPNQPET